MTSSDIRDIAAGADAGARTPGGVAERILFGIALLWSLFQLWYASPLPFVWGVLNLNFNEARAVHLTFALLLAFLAFPASGHAPHHRVPFYDWVLALLASSAAAYVFVFQSALQARPGLPITQDIVVGVVGGVLLLEATRRALGLPLVIVASVFLFYSFAGPWLPEVISHQGASLAKVVSHQWLTSEGVFGVPLGVSTSFVFLFVLFGALLERAGAGGWFIRVSYAALGHFRGGPAKAAVVSSGLTGLISGSSIANVVTTGTFTIPLMKRVGFPSTKAGAVEVAASVDGQIMPPVMGAAAFLMVEYVGIPYVDVIRHAFLPAVLSYAALLYIVHLEALKLGLEGMPRPRGADARMRLIGYGLTISGLIVFAGVVYWSAAWIKDALGDGAVWAGIALLAVVYVLMLAVAARAPDDDDSLETGRLPPLGDTVKGGLHYLVPVAVLVWCLMVERLSPSLSAFWATVTLIVLILTQGPLLRLMGAPGHDAAVGAELRAAFGGLLGGFVTGARNMVGIAIATAAAGIVVGTVTLTGLGLVMTELIEFISGGNLMLMLVFTAIISLILGMGLPTTANYIVVATLMAPVVVSLAANGGLFVPLIAVHLFVFYFGLMADVTPPVGLATFAAAAISRADPVRTGVQAALYSVRTIILPFIFIFNSQLLLIGVADVGHLVVIVVGALLAMLAFASGTMGWFVVRSRWYETVVLLLAAFILFRPGFFWDRIFPPFAERPASEISQVAASVPADGFLRVRIAGTTIQGKSVERALVLSMGDPGPAKKRLARAGLLFSITGGNVQVIGAHYGSVVEKAGVRAGWRVTAVLVPVDRPAKEWIYIAALILLAGIFGLQWKRRSMSPHHSFVPSG